MVVLKVSESRKQFLVSSILPRNTCWDNFQCIKLSQRSFFVRIEDTIICFRNCLTFSDPQIVWPSAVPENHSAENLIFENFSFYASVFRLNSWHIGQMNTENSKVSRCYKANYIRQLGISSANFEWLKYIDWQNLSGSLRMPKTSISWKSVWIHLFEFSNRVLKFENLIQI